MRFHLKEYAAEAVAFDSASGDTHYLAPLALALYRLFSERPGLTVEEARQRLALPARADAEIEQALAGLRRIGLIRPE